MSSTLNDDTLKAWHRFLMDLELAKNYHRPYELDNHSGVTPPNPLLDMLLPSLLYIRLVSLLDDALNRYLDNHGLRINKKNPTLSDRLKFLNKEGKLKNYDLLHDRIRLFRQDLAHGVLDFEDYADWTKLETDLNTIEDELQHLGVVSDRPQCEFFWERGPMRAGTEPGVHQARDYQYGIRCEGKVIEVKYTKNIFGAEGG